MSKRAYTKPSIIKHVSGLMNPKFQGYFPSPYISKIDGVPIDELVKGFGSPLFIFSERSMREKYRDCVRAFSLRYPRVQMAWSYKTNYLGAVCSVYHREGAWAEVVSDFEYEIAKELGVSGEDIIFNGPCKSETALKRAIDDGAKINVDGMDEIYLLEKIASEKGKAVEIGVRVNLDTGVYPAWDRFGLNLESGQAYEGIKRAVSGGRLKVIGIHCHIGTFILEPRLYHQATVKVCELAKRIKTELGCNIKYIDMGGGFASKNRLKASYLPTSQWAPPFDNYAEAICPVLLDNFPADELPLLILETGRALVDEAGSIAATVIQTKRLPSGTRSLILDAGLNILLTSTWYDMEITPTRDRGAFMENHVVYGPLCMAIDIIRESIRLPILERGDHVLISPTGAYTFTQSLQFIFPRPAAVLIDAKGETHLIRKREDASFVRTPEIIPPFLMREAISDS